MVSGIAQAAGWTAGVCFSEWASDFSPHHSVQTCSRARPGRCLLFTTGVERPGRDAEHFSLFSAEVNNVGTASVV
jgi:hypothetical protein